MTSGATPSTWPPVSKSTSEPNRIHVSGTLAAELEDRYRLTPRGAVELKGKGPVETCFLVGRRDA